MPPFAVCCNIRCPLYCDLHEERAGPTRLPPEKHPACEQHLFWYCPVCHWPLFEIPNRGDPRCFRCNNRLPFTSDKMICIGGKKMPYALCSNSKCGYSIELLELQNRPEGVPLEAPLSCPRCDWPMISICPECGFLLFGTPGATICAVCRSDIRRVYAKCHVRARSA